MKKLLSIFIILFSFIGFINGADAVYKTAKFGASYNSAGVGSYTATWYSTYNGFRVDIANANNNNNGWNYIKFGRKNNASIGTIITNAVIDKKVTKVVLKIDAITTSKINSITLYTSTNKSSWTSRGTFTKSTGSQTVTIAAGNQATNLYYKITFDCASGSSNGLIQISQVDFYVEEDATPISVTGISITDTVRLIEGNTETLTATITPSNATNKNIIWGSINTDIATVSSGTITAIAEGITKIWVKTEDGNFTDTCVVIVSPTPPEPVIDIARWDTNAVYINIDNFEGITAVLENQNTQADIEQNFADSIFFSKYFESKGNVKLLALYNGTDHDIDLSDYRIKIGEKGSDFTSGSYAWGRTLYPDSMNRILNCGDEVIFVAYDKSATSPDTAVIKCARDNEKSNWNSYVFIGNMNFNGNDAVGLFNPKGELIDIIGAGNKTQENLGSSSTVGVVAAKEFMDDPGWYSPDGININNNDSNYALSTTRCLLVRKKSVKSGLNAVSRNTTDFITLGGVYGEWLGLQVSKNDPDKGVAASCAGFDYVGMYDYNEYYIDYVTIFTEQPLPVVQEDGTYKIEVSQLDTLACTNLKVIVKDDNGNELTKIFKIPIMVAEDTYTKSDLFRQEKDDCPTCDVIIMHNAKLTVDSTMTSRHMKVYEGSRLNIESGKTYTLASLSLRKTDDINPYLTLNGNISLSGDSSFYLDIYTDPSEWRWLALPDTFDIRNITLSNGNKVTHGEDYIIKTYDGNKRAIEHNNSWVKVDDNKVFMPGEGFIFGIAGDGNVKQEYRFKFANSILGEEKKDKKLAWANLQSWGCNDTGLAPNHKGWNLVGNTFLDLLNTEIYNPIRVGFLEKEIINGNWTGNWVLSDTASAKLRYRVIYERNTPGEDGNGYSSQLLDDIQLEPFSTFFVQLGGNTQTAQEITLHAENRRNVMRRMIETDNTDDEVFLRIIIGEKKTGWFISNKFTEYYEPGDDLESRQTIYQLINGFKYLYSAVPDSTLINGVKVYSIGGHAVLDNKVNKNKFEYLYIKQGNNWYDLLHDEYDIAAGEFIVYAKVKREEISTNNNMIYINDGQDIFYDILGRRSNNIGNGVYIIKNNNSTIKVIR